MKLFDSHCHLQDARLESDLDGLVQRAAVAGRNCCGTSPSDWPRVEALAEQYRQVVPSYGLHPW